MLKQGIKEEVEDDEFSQYSKMQQKENEKESESDRRQDLSSENDSQSFDLKLLEEDAENHRNAYIKVANAFLEQDSDGSDNELMNGFETTQQRLQRKIVEGHQKEYEPDFQLTKLNVDNNPVLDVIEMTVFDRIRIFQDRTIYEKIYKKVWYIKELISHTCYCIVTHSLFTILSLSVIIFNSIMLAKDDPTTNTDNNASIDLALLLIYTIEMGLKILAFGFIFSKTAYVKDGWNMLDLIIIVTGWLPYVVNSTAFNLSALRSLRVLRPLKSISKVKVLNQLVTALFSAIPLLKDAMIILAFFFAVFGIAGLQLFTGQLKTRCVEAMSGIEMGNETTNLFVCALDTDCPTGYVCSKTMVSPNNDLYNFDTFGWSVLNVYVVVSNEGWTTIMYYVMVGFNFFAFLYFFLIVYLGTWLLVNLCMGIIAVKYTESIANQSLVNHKAVTEDGYSMANLIRWGIYKSNKILYKELDEQKKTKISLFQFSFQMSSLLASYKRTNEKKSLTQVKSEEFNANNLNNQNSKNNSNQESFNKNNPRLTKVHPFTQQRSTSFVQEQKADAVGNGDSNHPITYKPQPPKINLMSNEPILETDENDQMDTGYKKKNNNNTGSHRENGDLKINLQDVKDNDSTPKSNNQQKQNSNTPRNVLLTQEQSPEKNIQKRGLSPSGKLTFKSNLDHKRPTRIGAEQKSQFNRENKKIANPSEKERKNTQIIDPSILANRLEYINSDGKQMKHKTKRLGSQAPSKRDNQFQKMDSEESASLIQQNKKINFAPISKQKPKHLGVVNPLGQLQKQVSQDENGKLTDRKKSKQSIDIRRASKKLNHLFQFQDGSHDDDFLKMDDEEFLEQIEIKEKQMKKDQDSNTQDADIEDAYFKQLQNEVVFDSLKTKKVKNDRLSSVSPLKRKATTESGNSHSTDQKPNKIKHNKRTSLSVQKKQAYLANKGARDTSNPHTNKQSLYMSSEKTSFDEDSLSEISQMSFLDKDETPIDKSPRYASENNRRKTTVLNNLFSEFDIRVGKNKKFNGRQQTKRLSQKQKTQVKLNKYETAIIESSENQDQVQSIEDQLLKKINRQIDQKAEDFKLLLDSKYLKPRVIYGETSDYTREILPTKNQVYMDMLKKQQEDKIKRLRFKIKNQSSMIQTQNKKKSQQQKQTFRIPVQKSKRMEILHEDEIFQDILEGKVNTENHSIRYSKQGEIKNDNFSVDSPNPFKQIKPISFTQRGFSHRAPSQKDDDRNYSPQLKQTPSNANNLNRQANFVKTKLNNNDSGSEQIKDDDKNESLQQDIAALQSPSVKSKSVIADGEGELKESLNLGSKKEINNDQENKSNKNSLNDSINMNGDEKAGSTLKGQASIRNRAQSGVSSDQNNTSYRQKYTTKSTEKKNVTTAVSKKGKNVKGDDLEFDWNQQKAIAKIFFEEQILNQEDELLADLGAGAPKVDQKVDQKGQTDAKGQPVKNGQNQQNPTNGKQGQPVKSQYDVMVYQLEQKIIKKAERQMEILNRKEDSQSVAQHNPHSHSHSAPQSDTKSLRSVDTALTASASMTEDADNSMTQKSIMFTKQVEVFNMKEFEEEPADFKFLHQRKKDIHNLEKKGINELRVQTSADDVLWIALRNKNQDTINRLLISLNYPNDVIEQNEGGLFGLIQAFRRRIKYVIQHSTYENMIMLCVLMNTVILCTDGIVPASSTNTLNNFNYAFTIIFAVDMGLKLIGLGIVQYVSDKMNIFDAIIVSLSIFELAFLSGSKSSVSALRSIRILRVFRVLRVTRILRSLQFMKLLITAIGSVLEQFIYILVLLFLVMFIYALLGMSLFGGSWPAYTTNVPSRLNYDQFINAAFAVLDLLTLENWNDQLTTCLNSGVSNYVCVAYLISMIFIGNYILIDLVLAIMLDSFDSVEVQKDRKDIENRFEIAENITFNHTSMGSTFMNHLSQSGYPSQSGMSKMSGGLHGSQSGALQKSVTLSKGQLSNSNKANSQTQHDSGQLEKSRSILNGEDDSQSEGGGNNISSEQKITTQATTKSKKKQFQYFEGVKSYKSLYLFSQDGWFRRAMYRIYKHSLFEKTVLMVIILTSFKLTFDTYIGTLDVKATKFSNECDTFFTAFFLCECAIKVISLGFIMDEGSYLRDSWSQLDFFIVISSIVDMTLSDINLSAIKILRLLRTLRPLRLLSQNKSMKLIVNALIESMGGIANMIIVVLIIWLMFAILGMNLMEGKMQYCNTNNSQLSGTYNVYMYDQQTRKFQRQILDFNIIYLIKQKCYNLPGGFWDRYPVNSDNIGQSMIMLFVLSTFEGWPNYVWNYLDGSTAGPQWNNSKLFAAFFAVFIFVGSFFSINLFTAIISFNFDIASKKSKNLYLSDDQSQWIELQRLIVNSTPDFTSIKQPSNKFRRILWRIVESQQLEVGIIFCIIGNIFVMAMPYDTATSSYTNILQSVNLGFTCVFISECICKIIAYGAAGYFYKGWNQFDFFVVCTSLIDIVMTYSGNQIISFLRAGPQIARVLRVLRVSRLLKLMKSFQGLQKLIQTTVYAFPKFLNATFLFVLFYFIFSILAWYLFSDLRSGWRINSFWNFTNFHRSIILLVRMSTGEDWYLVMYDTYNAKGLIGFIYCIAFYTIQSYILMNLFVLIIMNEFEENYINPDNPLNNFNEQEEFFKKRWVLMTIKDNGIKIHEKYLTEFYFELAQPLGFGYKAKADSLVEQMKLRDKEISQEEIDTRLDKYRIRQKQEADKHIMKMNIFCDYEGYIYYNELFYHFFKFSLYDTVYEMEEDQMFDQKAISKHNTALELLKKEEKVSLKKIGIIKKKQSSLLKSKIVQQRQQGVNPMVRRLFVGMAFKSWLQYSYKTQENLNQINFNRDDISSQTDTDSQAEENEEKDNFFLDNSLDDGIEFKKTKPKIIKREHTIVFRPGGLKKYREEHEQQQQSQLEKKYYRLPNTDVYKIENYDEDNNQYINTKAFEVQTEENRKSMLQLQRPSLVAQPIQGLQARQSVLATNILNIREKEHQPRTSINKLIDQDLDSPGTKSNNKME